MAKTAIATDKAPAAIGVYSQAVRVGDTVYISGQIPIDPATNTLLEAKAGESAEDLFARQVDLVFRNLQAIAEAAGGSLDQFVKVNVYLTELAKNFAAVNQCMERHFSAPYPARAAVQVPELPKKVPIEVDAVMVLG